MPPSAINTLDTPVELTGLAAGNLEPRSWTTITSLDEDIGLNRLTATISQHFEGTLWRFIGSAVLFDENVEQSRQFWRKLSVFILISWEKKWNSSLLTIAASLEWLPFCANSIASWCKISRRMIVTSFRISPVGFPSILRSCYENFFSVKSFSESSAILFRSNFFVTGLQLRI